jgi:hypothetical protein
MKRTAVQRRRQRATPTQRRRAGSPRAAAFAGFLVALVAFTACDRGAPGDQGLDGLPVWDLAEERRLGHRDDPNLGFSRVGQIHVAPDGRTYVLDAQELQVRVFDPDGRLVASIGRRGSGPGEFQFPRAFGLLGDTLWVNDLMNQRLTFFSRSGELLGTVPSRGVPIDVGDPPVRLTAHPSLPLPDGTFANSYLFPARGTPTSLDVPRLRFRAEGETADTVGWSRVHFSAPIIIQLEGQISLIPHPLSDHPLSTDLPHDQGRIVVERRAASAAQVGTVTVTRLGEDDGDTVAVRTLAYRPLPVSKAFADSVLEGAVSRLAGMGIPDATARRVVADEVELPSFMPPVSRLLSAEDGTVWIRREDVDPNRHRWIVLDPGLNPVAEVRTPHEFRPTFVTADHVWGVETDDLEVPWVVAYRILR